MSERNERPDNCRNALRDAGKLYPKSGCAVCGSVLNGCPYERLAPASSDASQDEVGARYGVPLTNGLDRVSPCAAWFTDLDDAIVWATIDEGEVWDLVEGRKVWAG